MTKLLEMREWIKKFYGKFELYIKPAIRFVIALTAFSVINSGLGYMKKLEHPAISLLLALICAFLPSNAIGVFGVILILAHLFALSLEVFVIGLLLFLLMFFMYFKFDPGNGLNIVLTPLLFQFRIPQVMPLSLGLLKKPCSILSMICGTVTFYFLIGVRRNEALLGTAEVDEKAVSKFTLALQQLVGNKEMYLVLGAFVVTAIVVYLIRRQDINHSWMIAIGVGNAVNLAILLVGSFIMEMTKNIVFYLLGTAAAVVVGLFLQFFIYNLDYSRVERVQFEDDEYYYFVKAVPKSFVSVKEKRIKQINSRKNVTINKRELAEELDIDQDLLDD